MTDEPLEQMTKLWRTERSARALNWLYRNYVERCGEGANASPVLERLGPPSQHYDTGYWFESEDHGEGVACLYLEVGRDGTIRGFKMP